jgi:hypothetical protein
MTAVQIIEIMNSIEPAMWSMLWKAAAAFIIVYMLKQVLENIGNYLLFRFNKRLGLDVKVKINGTEGMIVDYNLNWIIIRTTNGGKVIIPTNKWKVQQWEILGYDKKG